MRSFLVLLAALLCGSVHAQRDTPPRAAAAADCATATAAADCTGTTATRAPDPPGMRPRIAPPIRRNVLVIEFSPLAGPDRLPLWRYQGWHDPETFEQNYAHVLRTTTTGVVDYSIVERIPVQAFPWNTNADRFTETSYADCLAELNDGTPGAPKCLGDDGNARQLDYERVLADFGVCELANRGKIDELWLWGGPEFGFRESTMAGPGAFETNGAVIENSSCLVKLNVMGFNYERGLAEMLENMSHRVEGTLRHLFELPWDHGGGGWTDAWRNSYGRVPAPWPSDPSPLEHLTARGFDNTVAACGNAHGSLNTPLHDPTDHWGYDVDNPHREPSTCDDWDFYPRLSGRTRLLDCSRWGCDGLGWQRYWLSRIPRYSGEGFAPPTFAIHMHNNWWRYVLDWDAVVPMPSR